jgi:N-acylglucosamine-6-phosphate 2-epimerase
MDCIAQLRHQIIVSVQADEGEPLSPPPVLKALATSVVLGGAGGLRLAQPEVIAWAKQAWPSLPVIGLTKPPRVTPDDVGRVYITPDWPDWQRLAALPVDIIATDATQRPRPGGESLATLVRRFRDHYPERLLMADVATLEDACQAEALGFDVVGTTLAGYTQETRHVVSDSVQADTPDWQLLGALCARLRVPVLLEGRVWAPWHVAQAMALGAWAVVIGSAITRPHLITRRFAQQLAPLKATQSIHSQGSA